MCQFKSAIVLRDESLKGGFKLLMNPWTESHSDLIALHKLNDNGHLHFARVEFSPKSIETAHDVSTYELKIDEDRKPDWFSDVMHSLVVERMSAYIKSIIIDGDVDLLLSGQFIVCGNATVKHIKTSVINILSGSAKVDYISDSAKVDSISGSANVGSISGSAKVDYIYGSAKVDYISGSANVGSISGSAKVDYISDSAKVDHISGSAKVDSISGSAKVDSISGSAKVGSIYDSAKVGSIYGSAKIENDKRQK